MGTVDVVVDHPSYFVAFELAPGKSVRAAAVARFVAATTPSVTVLRSRLRDTVVSSEPMAKLERRG
jgi:hypothetical protein